MKIIHGVTIYCCMIVCLVRAATEKAHNVERRSTMHHELTSNQKKKILDTHNELRLIVNPPAADMLKMSWDDRLQRLATEYTRKCIYEHNDERKLDGFQSVGENLHISYGREIGEDYEANAVKFWDSEKADYNYEAAACNHGKACGHYTQTAWAKSYKVGCGMTTCKTIQVRGKTWKDATLLACNYAPGGNMRGTKPYVKGTPCSQCDKEDTCSDKLCSSPARGDSGARNVIAESVWKITFMTIILQRIVIG